MQRNLTELVVAVTDENLVGLFAALLAERRVLLTASKLSTVSRASPAGGHGAHSHPGPSAVPAPGGGAVAPPLERSVQAPPTARRSGPGSAPWTGSLEVYTVAPPLGQMWVWLKIAPPRGCGQCAGF